MAGCDCGGHGSSDIGGGGDHSSSGDNHEGPVYKSPEYKTGWPGALVGVGVFGVMCILGFVLAAVTGISVLAVVLCNLAVPSGVISALMFDRWNEKTE